MITDALAAFRSRERYLNLQSAMGLITSAEREELQRLPHIFGGLVEGDPAGGLCVTMRPFPDAESWVRAGQAVESPYQDVPAQQATGDASQDTPAAADDVGDDDTHDRPTPQERFLFGDGYRPTRNRPTGGNVVRSKSFGRGD